MNYKYILAQINKIHKQIGFGSTTKLSKNDHILQEIMDLFNYTTKQKKSSRTCFDEYGDQDVVITYKDHIFYAKERNSHPASITTSRIALMALCRFCCIYIKAHNGSNRLWHKFNSWYETIFVERNGEVQDMIKNKNNFDLKNAFN